VNRDFIRSLRRQAMKISRYLRLLALLLSSHCPHVKNAYELTVRLQIHHAVSRPRRGVAGNGVNANFKISSIANRKRGAHVGEYCITGCFVEY